MADVKYKSQTLVAYELRQQLKSLNPNLNPDIKGGVIYSKIYSYAGIFSDLYSINNYQVRQVFIQNRTGNACDNTLYTYQLPPRNGGTPARGIANVTTTSISNVNIPAGTLLQNGRNEYVTTKSIRVSASQSAWCPFKSNTLGAGQQLPLGAILQIQGFNDCQGAVIDMTDGTGNENDASCNQRALDYVQFRPGGGNFGDWKLWLSEVPEVTGSYVIQPNTEFPWIGAVILSGFANFDILLSLAFSPQVYYSRKSSDSTLYDARVHLNSKIAIGAVFSLLATDTYIIDYAVNYKITAKVKLIPGISLSDIDEESGLTIEELIQREVRRGVLQTPVGTITDEDFSQDPRYIYASNIAAVVSFGLSSTSGFYGRYLQSVIINFIDQSAQQFTQIMVPNPDFLAQKASIVYDVSYTSIEVLL